MSQPQPSMLFSSTFFLLIFGALIAWLSGSKWEAALFVLVASLGIVVFGALPPKESENEPNILYFDLSAMEGQTRTISYAKYFAGMTIAIIIMSIPSILKYFL